MYTNRLFYLLIIALLMVTACAPQTLGQGEPITLHLAVADEKGDPSEPLVLEFIDQVKTLSNSNITIEPIWDAGKDTEAGFEAGVIQLVKGGKADLGLAASRAWDTQGITSFQALQAPVFIDNDALAVAVATSDIARQMLSDVSSSGLTGLTLWPEDLRHPFSLISGKPLLSPGDFAGLNIRTTPSGISNMMVEVLGGKPMFEESGYEGAESGLRQGAHLTGTPTATGNVTFFAKYQVLFANDAAFQKLSENQRAVLRQAVAATQKKAIAEHPSETDAASAWCADGGTIVLASDAQVAAFEAAAQPVLDSIRKDSFNAEMITAIRDLKTKTVASLGAQACAPDAQVNAQPTAGTESWSTGLLPNSVWRVELSAEDIIQMGVLKSKADQYAGTYTWTLKDGQYVNLWEDGKGNSGKCIGTYAVVEDFVRLTSTTDDCPNEVEDFQWRLDEDGLHIHILDIKGVPFTEVKATYEAKPWQKIAEQ
jgi:TRAP-type C4-dicarboxylate transport system substrate-binding protein